MRAPPLGGRLGDQSLADHGVKPDSRDRVEQGGGVTGRQTLHGQDRKLRKILWDLPDGEHHAYRLSV